jgi:hypothetical protein
MEQNLQDHAGILVNLEQYDESFPRQQYEISEGEGPCHKMHIKNIFSLLISIII